LPWTSPWHSTCPASYRSTGPAHRWGTGGRWWPRSPRSTWSGRPVDTAWRHWRTARQLAVPQDPLQDAVAHHLSQEVIQVAEADLVQTRNNVLQGDFLQIESHDASQRHVAHRAEMGNPGARRARERPTRARGAGLGFSNLRRPRFRATVWLLSLNDIFWSPSVLPWICTTSFHGQIIFHWMDIPHLCIHSFIIWVISVLARTEHPAMNNHV
jgi:hypothetical protein